MPFVDQQKLIGRALYIGQRLDLNAFEKPRLQILASVLAKSEVRS